MNEENVVYGLVESSPSFSCIDESNLSEEFLSERWEVRTPNEIESIKKNMLNTQLSSGAKKKFASSMTNIAEIDEKFKEKKRLKKNMTLAEPNSDSGCTLATRNRTLKDDISELLHMVMIQKQNKVKLIQLKGKSYSQNYNLDLIKVR